MENSNLAHNSILHHITGKSIYINDIPMPVGSLHAVPFYSSKAHAKIISINCHKARELKGVKAILNYLSIPGENQMGPIKHDEPCLAENHVEFIGQTIAVIAAETREIALKASSLIEIEYEELPSVTTIKDAIDHGELLDPSRKIETGDITKAFKEIAHQLDGDFYSEGQEHWYLETQTALCIPREGQELLVYSSSQHPSETQAIVAEVLGIPRHAVEVEVKRMGGAFGGKETKAHHISAWTALLAHHTGRAVKMHLTRDIDQIITGKRHAFYSTYKVGFNDNGELLALDVEHNSNGGAALDLSMAIMERALFHIDNAYYIPNLKVVGNAWKTNLPPNTAFRGFGAPQSMALIENIIDRIARFLKKDAAEIRQLNFYGTKDRNITHYGQLIEDNPLDKIYEEIMISSDYEARLKNIQEFNKANRWKKKGMGMSPVKFGISFTTSFLNQAGALVNIYQDGSVNVNHGGTEMGQGLHTKIRQIAALTLGISNDKVLISATNTSKVPNTSATAASSGTDLNGMAVENACLTLIERLKGAFELKFPSSKGEIIFENNLVKNETNEIAFSDLTSFAYFNQISLGTTGFYKTPDIHFDREKGKGKPFHYFAYGISISEVEIDVFTGKHDLLRTDILHDVGKSINPMLDRGQIEGAFVQGLGWVTTEELKYDDGRLLTHSPDTYKIPTIDDIPKDFRVELTKDTAYAENIKKSKAVGEPPFVHGLSVWLAIKDAISAVANHEVEPGLSIPATYEAVVICIERMKK